MSTNLPRSAERWIELAVLVMQREVGSGVSLRRHPVERREGAAGGAGARRAAAPGENQPRCQGGEPRPDPRAPRGWRGAAVDAKSVPKSRAGPIRPLRVCPWPASFSCDHSGSSLVLPFASPDGPRPALSLPDEPRPVRGNPACVPLSLRASRAAAHRVDPLPAGASGAETVHWKLTRRATSHSIVEARRPDGFVLRPPRDRVRRALTGSQQALS